jgi:hypothetical protein
MLMPLKETSVSSFSLSLSFFLLRIPIVLLHPFILCFFDVVIVVHMIITLCVPSFPFFLLSDVCWYTCLSFSSCFLHHCVHTHITPVNRVTHNLYGSFFFSSLVVLLWLLVVCRPVIFFLSCVWLIFSLTFFFSR